MLDGRPAFVPFGLPHLTALALTAATAATLSRLVRRGGPRTAVAARAALGLLLLGLTAAETVYAARGGWLSLEVALPLHLCDMAKLMALIALAFQHRGAAELLYFWAMIGTSLAMCSPDLRHGFPDPDFLFFYGLHGAVVVAAAVAAFGLRLTRAGAWRRAFAATAAFALLVAALNPLLDTNFMYLRHKPEERTILDWFGPWPLYILSGLLVALALFYLADLPLRRAQAQRGQVGA